MSTLYTKIIPFVKTAVDAEEVVICKNCPHKNEEKIRAIPVEKLGGSLKASTMLSYYVSPPKGWETYCFSPGVCLSVTNRVRSVT